MKLREVARIVGGEATGDVEIEIRRLSKIEEAVEGDVTFVANAKYSKHLSATGATAVLVSRDSDFAELKSRRVPIQLIKVDDPYRAFLILVDAFYPSPAKLAAGVHPTAVVARSAKLGNEVAVGPFVVIGERCSVADGSALHAGVVLYDDVRIGAGSTLYGNVTVREQCVIGSRVIIHSGTVVGCDGFGFAPKKDGTYEKIPQRGIVAIGDDVEIGSNCAIDRATIGETRIGRGVKLDNLIQVAHNVVIGDNTVIAAQTGISGSTRIGVNCVIAGQVGFAGHIHLADRSTVGAQSGVSRSFVEPGKTYFGYPAKEHLQALRMEGAARQLPELLVEIRDLKKRIQELESRIKEQ
jgi:UDP-3-O-[3-hydroxymyristoyl] glucosamine N-acyltransferase